MVGVCFSNDLVKLYIRHNFILLGIYEGYHVLVLMVLCTKPFSYFSGEDWKEWCRGDLGARSSLRLLKGKFGNPET